MPIFARILVLVVVLTTGHAFAGAFDELTADQKRDLEAGKQIFITQDTSESAWPKVYIYHLVHATPEESAAVFTDYEYQINYVPSMIKSKISRRIDKSTVEVDYEVHVPIVANEVYTVRDQVFSYDNGASFKITWEKVRASSSKGIAGNVRFEAHGTGGTLMAYYNYVIPGSSFANLVRGKALQQMKEAAVAVVEQIEKEHREGGELLQKQIQALRAAVSR